VSASELDRAWIEQVTGGRIERIEAMPGGGSRGMWLLDVVTPEGAQELVVRRDTGGGPYAGTELASLEREATVYAALAGRGIPAPELVAVSADGRDLIGTRLRGSNDFHGIADPDEKDAVRLDFIVSLARLHALEPAALELDQLSQPAGVHGQARAWLSVWQRLFDERVRRPVPVLRFALQWLHDHAPADVERTVVCHGDVGPGNFLHEGGAVTGLVDWELCHLGDPHDDLGMLALRAYQLNGFGDLEEALRAYEAASGAPVDVERVRYYRAVALVLGLTTSVMQLDATREARIQVPLFLHLVPTLQLLLTQALAELLELGPIEPPAHPTAIDDPPEEEALAALRDEIARLPVSGEPVLGAGPAELVAHLEAAARLGPAIDADDVAELAELLGSRPATYSAGLVELDDAVAARRVDPAAMVRWAWRSGTRRVALWPAWEQAMAMPLLRLGR
jgi:aminoglycoside phosphotransferase (APT) family kinase protein